MAKQLAMIPLFEDFVNDSYKGKRLKSNGKKIREQTVDNYRYVLILLQEFEQSRKMCLYVKELSGRNKRELMEDSRYWKRFYYNFTDFSYQEKHYFDNYAGGVVKIIRIFFSYLRKEKMLNISDVYKKFYICKEEIPIHTLLPTQLKFLINDSSFENSLPSSLKQTKDIFIIGCTVALRCSDLFNLRISDIEETGEGYYLSAKSIKTDTVTKVKLPPYVIDILAKYKPRGKRKKTLLPYMSMSQFNKNIMAIGEKAGWTHEVNKTRSRRGVSVEIRKAKKSYRFCDHLSSHTMRRTALPQCLC